jgi:hypothetical protein
MICVGRCEIIGETDAPITFDALLELPIILLGRSWRSSKSRWTEPKKQQGERRPAREARTANPWLAAFASDRVLVNGEDVVYAQEADRLQGLLREPLQHFAVAGTQFVDRQRDLLATDT